MSEGRSRGRDTGGRLRILLLCDDWPGHANTIHDHIAALCRSSVHEVVTYNPRGLRRHRLLDFEEFDVVAIHYSLCVLMEEYLPETLRIRLRRYSGLKVQFIQDDYRWVDAITAVMRDIGIHLLFTLVPTPEIPKIWTEDRLPGVVKRTTLAGYVPMDLAQRPVPDLAARPLDIAYRGRATPYWLGWIGQEKAWIAQGVAAHAERLGLKVDVDWRETSRIYGERWIQFITSARATLGSESGATITDFDGSIERGVKAYLAAHPDAAFEEVHREVLAPHEGNVRMNVVSPRVFEAIALRTALVLFPGEYSGAVRPNEHYIPLSKDFSNIDEVASRLRDVAGLRAMVARAYADVVESGRFDFRAFVREFDEAVAAMAERRRRGLAVRYRAASLETRVRRSAVFARATDAVAVVRRSLLVARFTLAVPGLAWAWTSLARRTPGVDLTRLYMDVMRFGALRYCQAGRVTLQPHRVTARLVGDRLVLLSEATDAWGRPRPDSQTSDVAAPSSVTQVLDAISRGEVARVVWNHSLLAAWVLWPWSPDSVHQMGLGDHGVYEFEALGAIGRRWPEFLARILAPLLREEGVEALRFAGVRLLAGVARREPGTLLPLLSLLVRSPRRQALREALRCLALRALAGPGTGSAPEPRIAAIRTDDSAGLVEIETRDATDTAPAEAWAAAARQLLEGRLRGLAWRHRGTSMAVPIEYGFGSASVRVSDDSRLELDCVTAELRRRGPRAAALVRRILAVTAAPHAAVESADVSGSRVTK